MHQLAIGIPTRNRRDMLLELLDDITNYAPNLPVVISDNSQDDNTEQAIALFQSRLDLRYFHCKKSLSQAENFNLLLRNTEADYVLLMHDDDRFLPHSIENYLNIINHLKTNHIDLFGIYVSGLKFQDQVPIALPHSIPNADLPTFVSQHLRIFEQEQYIDYFAEAGRGGRAAGVLVNRALMKTCNLEFPTDTGAKHDKAFFLLANRLGAVGSWSQPIIAVRLHQGRSIHRNTTRNYILLNRKLEQIYGQDSIRITQVHRQRFETWQRSESQFMPLECLNLLDTCRIPLFEKMSRFWLYLMQHAAHRWRSASPDS